MHTWNSKKKGNTIHELNSETGKTFCKIENSSTHKFLDSVSETPPADRRVCSVCLQMKAAIERRKNKKVCSLAVDVDKDRFLMSDQWKMLRYKAFKLYGRQCLCCGATPKRDGIRLQVDHVKPRSRYPELALDINNLQILCSDCNLGKGAWDETDYRTALPVKE